GEVEDAPLALLGPETFTYALVGVLEVGEELREPSVGIPQLQVDETGLQRRPRGSTHVLESVTEEREVACGVLRRAAASQVQRAQRRERVTRPFAVYVLRRVGAGERVQRPERVAPRHLAPVILRPRDSANRRYG